MLEKGKISAVQMGFILYPTIVASAILVLPGITAKYAQNDLWLSPVLASSVGFITLVIAYRLHERFPNQSLIQYSERIVGRIAGKAIGLVFLLFYLHTNGMILRQYTDFISVSFLPRTPMVVIASTLILTVAYSVRSGIESVVRSSFICTAIFLITSFLFLLLLPDMDFKNLLPVMEHGVVPSLRGAFVPQSWFGEFFLISFLLPFVTNAKEGLKWGLRSVFAAMIGLTYINLMILFLFGEQVSEMLYPVLTASRYISIGGFMENFESVLMAVWILGNFVKISMFYYAVSIGLAQWLRLTDLKPIVIPIGILTVLCSYWSFPNFQHASDFLKLAFPIYGTIVQTAIPSLLLLIAFLRGATTKSSA
jgi:spore germination protein KB